MKIKSIYINNFRRLHECRIDFTSKSTIFVGANNSGKTSAMDALSKFLKRSNSIKFNDITLSNRQIINDIGQKWIEPEYVFESSLSQWAKIMPALDVWLEVFPNELHHVANIIPSLDWQGGVLGIRLLFQPIQEELLFKDFIDTYRKARDNEQLTNGLNLEPSCLCDFIQNKITSAQSFGIHAYILDPSQMHSNPTQETDFEMECLNNNPFDGIIKVDMIDAQREVINSDNSSDTEIENNATSRERLSPLLRSYYKKHLDPENEPSAEDLEILKDIHDAHNIFGGKLAKKFKSALEELELLGYPGVNNPQISLEPKMATVDVFQHPSAVQYTITQNSKEHKLPEQYNGLGYQNLLSMFFRLISFRDARIKKGKVSKTDNICPLHIILLEEPEAHLHVQVQQVFIRESFKILTNNNLLRDNKTFSTQLIISTHSSHVAREANFAGLRYFKRISASDNMVPSTKVINLSDVFGKEDETAKFVTRYLQTTHCDIFFADAIILIEGAAERMLLPHFIKESYSKLSQSYITILEINGSHAHRLQPLISKLSLTTLIITDIDPVSETGHHATIEPKRDNSIWCGNATLRKFFEKNLYTEFLNMSSSEKVIDYTMAYPHKIRVAYQIPIMINFKSEQNKETLPRSLEDAIFYTNISLIGGLQDNECDDYKLIKKLNKHYKNKTTVAELQSAVHETMTSSNVGKAEFALDLIFSFDPSVITIPNYIAEGLDWLTEQLNHSEG